MLVFVAPFLGAACKYAMFGQTYVHYLRSPRFWASHHHWCPLKLCENQWIPHWWWNHGRIPLIFSLANSPFLTQSDSISYVKSSFSHMFPYFPIFSLVKSPMVHPFPGSIPVRSIPSLLHLFAMSATCQVQGVGPAHHPWRRKNPAAKWWNCRIFMDLHGFSWIFMDFHGFSWIFQIFIDVSSSWKSRCLKQFKAILGVWLGVSRCWVSLFQEMTPKLILFEVF